VPRRAIALVPEPLVRIRLAQLRQDGGHRVGLVVVGPLDHHGEPSGPVADWVREANEGRELWFVDDLEELDRRLSGART